MLNSAEDEILNAGKYINVQKFSFKKPTNSVNMFSFYLFIFFDILLTTGQCLNLMIIKLLL